MNNMPRSIKWLASIELFLLLVVSMFLGDTDSYLPGELQTYVQSSLENYEPSMLYVASVLLITVLHLASLVGLLLSKSWSINIYILSVVFLLILGFFEGSVVDHSFSIGLQKCIVLVQGMLLSLLIIQHPKYNQALNRVAGGI